jgi:hypothetical protein
MARPLGRGSLEYAAEDISLIRKLQRHFAHEGFLRYDLYEKSERYMTVYRAELPNAGEEHGLLPLDIMTHEPSALWCNSCYRHLSLRCFSEEEKRQEEKRDCYVCRAIQVQEGAAAAARTTGLRAPSMSMSQRLLVASTTSGVLTEG